MIHICKVVLRYLGCMRSLNLPLLSCKSFGRNIFLEGIFYTEASDLWQQPASFLLPLAPPPQAAHGTTQHPISPPERKAPLPKGCPQEDPLQRMEGRRKEHPEHSQPPKNLQPPAVI